jgi:hypothetical protein
LARIFRGESNATAIFCIPVEIFADERMITNFPRVFAFESAQKRSINDALHKKN